MRAADVMTRTVSTVREDAPLNDVIQRMVDDRISGMPVTDANGKLTGMITEGDLLRRSETGTGKHRPAWLDFLLGPNKAAADYIRTHSRSVADIMTRTVQSVTEDEPLDAIVDLMERRHIKRVPVMRGDAIVGIVSRADLVRALANAIASEPVTPLSDPQIEARLNDELKSMTWNNSGDIRIEVKDGVVTLDGVIFSESRRAPLRVAAQNIPGVKAVEDHLVWVEPVTGMSV